MSDKIFDRTIGQSPSSSPIRIVIIGVAALVANLYCTQSLVASIAPEFGVSPDLAGSIVSVTQIGYGTGLFLLVPMADLVDNRKLVLTLLGLTILGLLAVATSSNVGMFFVAFLLIGVLLTRMMPAYRPSGGLRYRGIITTMVRLPAKMPMRR